MGLTCFPSGAAKVTWVGGSGDSNAAANWNTGALPEQNYDVVIDQSGLLTITHSSAAHSVNSVLSRETFILSGGTLTVSSTVQVNNGSAKATIT
jgi:hypothetical protein